MSGPGHRSILLTTPEGNNSPLHQPDREREGSPKTVYPEGVAASASGGVQFDPEQLERGRSRTKYSKATGTYANSSSKAASRSRSRSSRRSRDEEFLKWTVLRRDPSMRLKFADKVAKNKTNGSRSDDSEEDGDEHDDDDDDSDGDMYDEDDYSDEEQVQDVENDYDIDSEFHYDLGMKVLPNFVVSLNDVLDSGKRWAREHALSPAAASENDAVKTHTLAGNYMKATQLLTKGRGSGQGSNRSYILCTDLSMESQYALTYVMGAVVGNGDTLYIVNWDNSTVGDTKARLQANVSKCRSTVLHMFDCISAVIDDLDVVILSLQHPYPKHLLNEMVFGLRPVALCCSLSMVLSTLQNFVCSIPTLVIRKKLKRAKKKGISE